LEEAEISHADFGIPVILKISRVKRWKIWAASEGKPSRRHSMSRGATHRGYQVLWVARYSPYLSLPRIFGLLRDGET
jgi:hypothetical protein